MRDNYTDITFIIDASGSMYSVVEDTIGGFNAFINEQKQGKGFCTINIHQFNTTVTTILENTDVNEAPALDRSNYKPNGNTALLDALGNVIISTGKRYAQTPEHQLPSLVIMVVITDGLENSSRMFTNEQIKEMVKHQEDVYQWEFVYLGANQDAFHEARKIGIERASNYNMNKSSVVYDKMSAKLAYARSFGTRSKLNFTKEDYDDLA